MDRLLHTQFLEVAETHPERTAIRHGQAVWTYGELHDHALGIAGVLPESPPADHLPVVAILGTKSPGSIAPILGALCAGYAYSTIAPSSPRSRIESALQALRPTLLVLTGLSDRLRQNVAGVAAPIANLMDLGGDAPVEAFQGASRCYPGSKGRPRNSRPDDLAYILFTSGSTGSPKGVCMSHRAASMAVEMFLDALPVGPSDRIGNQVELCFDLSMFDIFTSLSSGAELCLLSEPATEPDRLFRTLRDCEVTSLFTVPSVVNMALQESAGRSPALRRVLFSGEKLTVDLLTPLFRQQPTTDVWNLYGGTEMPYVLAHQVSRQQMAAANTLTLPGNHVTLEISRMGESNKDVDEGELIVRGPAVLSGYLEPGSALPSGQDFHATGDLVRRQENGGITVLGRRDRQVKIDGVRVELDAIERQLERHPRVIEAAVLPSADRREIAAWIAVQPCDETELRGQLERLCDEHLSPIEQPETYTFLTAIPRTVSGKKERRLLEYCAPMLDPRRP